MMKLSAYINSLMLLVLMVACTKTEEPPKPIGKPFPYTGDATKSLTALLDAIPEATIYKAAFNRSGIQRYMDSISGGVKQAPYTLFVPTDKALLAAGYTADMPFAMADSLVRYLALPGNFPVNMGTMPNGTSFYPLMYPDPQLRRTMPTVYTKSWPYFYCITVGFSGNSLLLNGKVVKVNAKAIAATNGTIFMIDSLVTKPQDEMYEVLTRDTAFSFYMAALRRSNDLYKQKGILGDIYNITFNDTSMLMLGPSTYTPGSQSFAVLFVPVNDAFRKAGFHSIDDINAYIGKSVLASSGNGTQLLTNMDSVLANHRLLYAFGGVNTGCSYLYTSDLLTSPYSARDNGSSIGGAIIFQHSGSTITLHRQDALLGRGATIIGQSDITTLNGVVHRVDNLLLTTP
ncbi:fasciclin domain-containing protein [Chitinophaga sp. 30R24]|uniref:fasciclin domain-containing protein n=1 Tax=Chitinophaga sp. 30R24 TaxID=3248838 RepID=UPI003B8FDD39